MKDAACPHCYFATYTTSGHKKCLDKWGVVQENYCEALVYAVSMGDYYFSTKTLMKLGQIHFEKGDFAVAEKLYSLAYETAKDIENKELMGLCIIALYFVKNIKNEK